MLDHPTNLRQRSGESRGLLKAPLKPDFGVYEEDKDYEELLRDGLRAAQERGEQVNLKDVRGARPNHETRRTRGWAQSFSLFVEPIRSTTGTIHSTFGGH